jgi:hypothetical protein
MYLIVFTYVLRTSNWRVQSKKKANSLFSVPPIHMRSLRLQQVVKSFRRDGERTQRGLWIKGLIEMARVETGGVMDERGRYCG